MSSNDAAKKKQRYAEDVYYREIILARNKRYAEAHRDEISIKKKSRYIERRDVVLLNAHTYYQKNRDAIRARIKQYRVEHPEIDRAKQHRRRANIRGNGGTHTGQDELGLLVAQEYRCFYCNKPLFATLDPDTRHIEHINALSNGGSNAPFNLVYACVSCNQAKRGLADSADALLLKLLKDGTLTRAEAYHKALMIHWALERKENPILWTFNRTRLQAGSALASE